MNTPELPDIPAFCDICCMYTAWAYCSRYIFD